MTDPTAFGWFAVYAIGAATGWLIISEPAQTASQNHLIIWMIRLYGVSAVLFLLRSFGLRLGRSDPLAKTSPWQVIASACLMSAVSLFTYPPGTRAWWCAWPVLLLGLFCAAVNGRHKHTRWLSRVGRLLDPDA